MIPLSLAIAIGLAGLAAEPAPASQNAPTLGELVTAYFRAEDVSARAETLRSITTHPEASVEQVGRAIGEAQLWEPATAGMQSLDVAYGDGRHVRVRVRVPRDYDPAKRYPVVFALHGAGGRAADCLDYYAGILGGDAESFIIAAPQDYRGMWFLTTEAESEEPVAVLGALRRQYHLDTERVYLSGYGVGGDAAFMTAVLYPDWFASAVVIGGTYTTPNTPATKTTLLPNLSGLPLLVVWGEHALLDCGLRGEMADMGPGGVEFVELAGTRHDHLVPPAGRLAYYLGLRRDGARSPVAHWFRFPAQGRRGWLRLAEFAGEPWEGEIVFRVRLGHDVEQFATEAVRGRLGRLEGVIAGQKVRVRLERVAKAEVLLSGQLVDLAKPVTVVRGGEIVFDRLAVPKVSTMLELAREEWEFQTLPAVRIVVPARGKGWQD